MWQLILLAETLPPWLDEVVLIAIEIFGAAFVLFAVLAMRKLGQALGLKNTAALEEIGRENAIMAIHFSDRWARLQDDKPSKESKLEKGLDDLIATEGYKGVTKDLRGKLARRIEVELEIEAKIKEAE